MYSNVSNISDCSPSSLDTTKVIVACLFFIMFPFALLLNAVTVWVSFHLRSVSTFVVYLKNLVLADLLMTATIPPLAANLLPGAKIQIKVFLCRYAGVIFYTSLYTSITLMGLISLDRFFKIVRPWGTTLGQNVMFSKITSTFVWVALLGVTAVPTMILTDETPHNDSEDICLSLKGPVGLTFHRYVVSSMEILFWICSVLIVSCYVCIIMRVLQSFRNSGSNNGKGKKKTKLRVFVVLLVFCVCFVPLHILRIPLNLQQVDVCNQEWLLILHELAIWVASTNVFLDQFLYVLLCKNYKNKLTDMVKGAGICILNRG
ncbi:P2Y purinoceptor 13-like [Xiphophorus couchianus]|uniref:P2Y purinoceptor 13-like n=1 Tax=Xiphophorus couchianus TaxID=32473 RepID=UPI001016313C|nr:P2Y purinoceptor 13-like [Xiphophorus couchianus]